MEDQGLVVCRRRSGAVVREGMQCSRMAETVMQCLPLKSRPSSTYTTYLVVTVSRELLGIPRTRPPSPKITPTERGCTLTSRELVTYRVNALLSARGARSVMYSNGVWTRVWRAQPSVAGRAVTSGIARKDGGIPAVSKRSCLEDARQMLRWLAND